jgi:AraC family transcriptional regulator, regulatory protein of adaptative response / methylphosphotriester-DNA alkyltransferase methyltransferase
MNTRPQILVDTYLLKLEQHMDDLKKGTAENTLEIKDFAGMLHVHPRHLSNTVHEVMGKSPCDLYEEKLLAVAKELLHDPKLSISDIARQLSFDPSNFTKYFRRYNGTTPKQFRQSLTEKN